MLQRGPLEATESGLAQGAVGKGKGAKGEVRAVPG